MKIANHRLSRSVLSVALGLCLASAVHGQSVTGSIFGSAPAQEGTTVVVKNLETGLTRTLPVDSSGRYRVPSLPVGRYKVVLERNGTEVGVRDEVAVTVAGGTQVDFAGKGEELSTIQVLANAAPAIDVSQVDTRSVFTAEQLQKLPLARDIASVALLAPGVVRNDSYNANGNTVPSFGGAASSENAYYINGYPVTNPLTSIGFSTLPFDAIDQEQILTGGYGAEFGRATGGVINIVTKRGTKEWKGGIYTIWAPEALRANPRNSYFPQTGFFGDNNPDPNKRTDGKLYQLRNHNQYWTETTGVYASGPIVQDHLYIYVNAEQQRREGEGVAITTLAAPTTKGGWIDYSYKYPRWNAKLDWNINDNHVLEFTGVSDVTRYHEDGYTYSYADDTHGADKNSGSDTEDNAKLYIGKYTGYLTDELTLSAMYGQQKIDHVNDPWGYRADCPRISASTAARYPGFNYTGCQTAATHYVDGQYDKTKGGRLDLSYVWNSHEFHFGYDRQDAESYTGSEYAGGYVWVYSKTNNPNAAIDASHGVGSPASAGGLGPEGYYVRRQYYTQLAKVKTEQEAQYVEDRWQVADNVLLSIGLRNEQFTNYTGSNEAYIRQRHQLAPRLGAAWDVHGDSSLKLFGNAGRYHLALPNNVAVRAASASLYTQEYFTYTGVDPVTGAPTGLTHVPVDTSLGYACPGNPYAISSNLECGTAPDPRTVAAVDIKSHYQDEYIVGMEQAIDPLWSWGAKATYRNLRSAIDDTCTPALGGACFLFNPGQGNTFYEEQADGSFKKVYYSAQELGLPKLKRKYYALDFFLERQMSDNWYGKIDYTFSRNYGNTEGQLASDLDTGTGGQADVSVTQDWDLPQLMVGANGLLPNHRAHQFKVIGMYEFSKEYRLAGTLIAASGRPKNCTSYYPTADAGLYNGAYYHFCGIAGSGTAPGSNGYVPPSPDYRPSPRGSEGTTPWTFTLNLSFAYTPNWAKNNLTVQADVLNVLNRQVAGQIYPRYAASRTEADARYGQELSYSTPRTMRLTVRYDF